jgi:hypothetical protein
MGFNSGSYWRLGGAKKPYKQAVFHCFDTAHVPTQPSDRGTAATGKMAGADDVNAAIIADGAGGAAGADGSAETIANNLAAGRDYPAVVMARDWQLPGAAKSTAAPLPADISRLPARR